jgi:hypothetical protein
VTSNPRCAFPVKHGRGEYHPRFPMNHIDSPVSADVDYLCRGPKLGLRQHLVLAGDPPSPERSGTKEGQQPERLPDTKSTATKAVDMPGALEYGRNNFLCVRTIQGGLT